MKGPKITFLGLKSINGLRAIKVPDMHDPADLKNPAPLRMAVVRPFHRLRLL